MFGSLLLLSLGCTPVLNSPDDSGADLAWVAPSNTWPMGDGPPEELVAEGFKAGQVPPDMRLKDQHGDEVSLWQFYGYVVALDVSTIWCGPCRELAAEVDEVWNDYKDQDFMYLTMLPEDATGQVPDQADLQEWATDYDISAPVMSDAPGYSYEVVGSAAAFPRIVVMDREMVVSNDEVTPAEDSAIRAAIEAEL